MFFQEIYFSCYILLAGKMLIAWLPLFLDILDNMFIKIISCLVFNVRILIN